VWIALSDGVMLDALFLPAAPGNLHWMPLPLSHDNSWESILSHGGFSPHAPPPSPGKYKGLFYLERISVSKHIHLNKNVHILANLIMVSATKHSVIHHVIYKAPSILKNHYSKYIL